MLLERIAAENLDRHVYDILFNDAPLAFYIPGGIHSEVAPAGTTLDHLLMIGYLPGNDRNLMGDPSKRAWTRFGALIKSVTQGESFAPNFLIMKRVDEILGGTHTRTVLGIYKSGEVRYTETDGDLRWNHYGYIYRAIALDG